MNINQLKSSRFLKKEDCGNGILVTIRDVSSENVSAEGAPEESKFCVHFDETEKPMVLNSTNGQIIAQIVGSPESDDWKGHKVVLYNDPTVGFGGKITGGIRVRAPRGQAAAKTAPAAKPAPAKALPSDNDGGNVDSEVGF